MKKQKQLKIWNGRGHGKYNRGHVYVAAYTGKQACEIVGEALGLGIPLSYSELKNYYNEGVWGNTMNGITPTEPCVYVTTSYFDRNPIRIK